MYGGAISAACAPAGGLVAGDPQATNLARLIMLMPIRIFKSHFSQCRIRVFVDDLTIHMASTLRDLLAVLPKAVALLHAELLAIGCLPGAKSRALGPTPTIARLLAARFLREGVAWEGATSGRDIGVDTSAGGRRTTRVMQSRLCSAATRARKMAPIVKKTRAATSLFKAGAMSSAAWGSSVKGVAPSSLATLRGASVAACGFNKRGACTTSAFRIVMQRSSDPSILLPLRQFKNWVFYTAQFPQLRDRLMQAWGFYCDHLSTRTRWSRVRGPMGAIIARI